MKKIKNSDSFPTFEHYGLIIFKTTNINHEGDERSRTNPGHGYPAYSETVNNFEYFYSDKNSVNGKYELETELKRLYTEKPGRQDFVCFESSGKLDVRTNVSISVR